MVQEDLVEALKELLISSEALVGAETPKEEERNRYNTAVDRARRVIARAER